MRAVRAAGPTGIVPVSELTTCQSPKEFIFHINCVIQPAHVGLLHTSSFLCRYLSLWCCAPQVPKHGRRTITHLLAGHQQLAQEAQQLLQRIVNPSCLHQLMHLLLGDQLEKGAVGCAASCCLTSGRSWQASRAIQLCRKGAASAACCHGELAEPGAQGC